MLEDLKREFTISANRIPNWRKMSKISIARGYVENENDELLKDSYFSAFALRFWHEIPTLYKECKFLVDRLSLSIEDIADWYIEGLLNVFKYRAFMNDKVYTYDEKGKEDKFINGYVYRAIDNVRERYFQYYNYDKRKSNINVSSLDQFVDDNGDSLLKDDVDLKYGDIDKVIRRLIENNDIYEALVMYSVTYGNSFSKVYEDGKCVAKYNPKKTSHIIMDLEEDEINKFISKYGNDRDLEFELEKYRYYNKDWQKVLYSNAIEKLQQDEEIKQICFNRG